MFERGLVKDLRSWYDSHERQAPEPGKGVDQQFIASTLPAGFLFVKVWRLNTVYLLGISSDLRSKEWKQQMWS